MAPRVPAQKLQSDLRAAILDSCLGKEESSCRVIVRFVKCSTRLSDDDNLPNGYKALRDKLRDHVIKRDDDPKNFKGEYSQVQVKKREACGTWLEIIFPD
jgi:hypothetical protein